MEIRLQIAPWRDYLALTKPRVVLLHLVTASAAMVLAARGLPSITILVSVLIGGGLIAGASNALNCYFDRGIDKMMVRTRNRPLPSGRMNPEQALTFSVVMALAGILILNRFVGWEAMLLAVSALAYYILVYTLWLKQRTYWSSIVGSGAGAFPPIIGWFAVTGRIEIIPILLFALIVFWTPPHFWSLAIFRLQDYELAGLEVIPARNTARWIAIFSFLLVGVSFLLVKSAHLGILYAISALSLGTVILILAMHLQLKESPQTARYLYLYSIFYLVALFCTMLVDKLGR
jgi:heme o synthase